MANLTALSPTKQQREVRISPSQVIGGLFETAFETIIREGPVVPEILDPQRGWEVIRPETRATGQVAIGGQTEMIFNDPAQVRLREVQWRLEKIIQTNQAIKAVETKIEIEREARLEEAGMSDEQLAEKGNYQKDYRGQSLKSLYNRIWVFMKLVGERLALRKKQATPLQEMHKRTAAKGAVGPQVEFDLNKQGENFHGVTRLTG